MLQVPAWRAVSTETSAMILADAVRPSTSLEFSRGGGVGLVKLGYKVTEAAAVPMSLR
jgi:hypothetical protein